jgi:hypothetical protein
MKHLETGETVSDHPKVDISSVVERAATHQDTIERELTDGRSTEHHALVDEFVPTFAADNPQTHVEEKFKQ